MFNFILKLKFKLLNMFREFLVHHCSSLEFRAELILLVIMSDKRNLECKEKIIQEISKEIYGEDQDRSRLLLETIHEFYDKISTNNGLDYTDLITKIINDIKRNPRFIHKININHLKRFRECIDDDEELIFQDRIIEFLSNIKEEYAEL